MSILIPIPFNKLVLKKRYMIETHKLIYIGTYYYMFGPNDPIRYILGLGELYS